MQFSNDIHAEARIFMLVALFAGTALFVSYLFAISAKSIGDDTHNEKDSQQKNYRQACDMCGSEWIVTPSDRNEKLPATVEWCFNDGGYCEVGFEMILDAENEGETKDRERRWLNHCMVCSGCRCAAFSPEEWRKITEAIESLTTKVDE